MESREKKTRRTEAAEISKKAILDAAEALFAQKGYEATSFQEICDLAGVTRGLPNYFFGSKEHLYRAVLERTFALPLSQDLIRFLREQAQYPDNRAEENLRVVIERIFDFLVTHPTFIRLTEWEALNDGRYLGDLPVFLTVLREAVRVLQEDMGWQSEAEQFLIDLTALCWFPVAHADTFLKPLGVNAHDPDFLERRKQHVITLLLGSDANRAKER
jgi:AcrR family transcriptional regulator